VKKAVTGGNTTVYIFSGSKVIAEYDNGAAPGSPSREYIYSGAALLAKVDSTGTHYYHQDHLSNRLTTTSSGAWYAEMGTFPYGESWYNTSGDKLQFTTYETDSESGNNYAQARSYVNRLARFSSVDPLPGSTSDPQSLNRYSYVRNMPVMFADPSGACPASAKNDKDFVEGHGSLFLTSLHGPDPDDDADPDPQINGGSGDCGGIYFNGEWMPDGGLAGSSDSGRVVGVGSGPFPVGSSVGEPGGAGGLGAVGGLGGAGGSWQPIPVWTPSGTVTSGSATWDYPGEWDILYVWQPAIGGSLSNSPGGGSSGGGGSGGGGSIVDSLNSLADCTKRLSNAGSLQNAAGLQKSAVAGVFLGNNVASAIQLAQDIGNLNGSGAAASAVQTFGSNATQPVGNAVARVLPTVVATTVSVQQTVVATSNVVVSVTSVSVSSTSLSLSSLAKNVVGQVAGALTLKTLADFYVAGRAAAACYSDAHP